MDWAHEGYLRLKEAKKANAGRIPETPEQKQRRELNERYQRGLRRSAKFVV